jgi:hypothetical protein
MVAGFANSIETRWAQVLGEDNPLHHCVQLVRDSAFGVLGWVGLLRVGAHAVRGPDLAARHLRDAA